MKIIATYEVEVELLEPDFNILESEIEEWVDMRFNPEFKLIREKILDVKNIQPISILIFRI